MDALSEVLSAVHMTGALFLNAELTAPWGVAVPDSRELAKALAPAAEHIVNFHLVLEGEMSVRDEAGAPIALKAGDIVIVPYGDPHWLCGGAATEYVNSGRVLDQLARGDVLQFSLGGGGTRTRIVCGFFACRKQAMQLFLSGLPKLLTIPVRGSSSGAWIENSIRHLVSDEETGRPGRSVMLSRMAEALFVESMRRYMESLPDAQTGWLAAARDPLTGRVLTLMHGDPARRWSTAELAEAAGASRSAMSERFARLMGESPMAYLARCRLHMAARLLETTKQSVLQLAGDVGYESEASFNRAFKREFGAPPARYRRQVRMQAPAGE